MEKPIKQSIEIARQIADYLNHREESLPEQLAQWLAESDAHRKILDDLLQGKEIARLLEQYDNIHADTEWERWQQRRGRTTMVHRFSWRQWAAAAAILLLPLMAIGLWWQQTTSTVDESYVCFVGDQVKPGRTLATLSIGQAELVLDEHTRLSTRQGTVVTDSAGHSLYVETTSLPQERCLSVPRGGEYYLELEDGTRVWLNADSRIWFPEHFAADRRLVRIEGEAYLEVASQPDSPFYVEVGAVQVHVTGTAFNVRHFGEESALAVTLAEGHVCMETNDGATLARILPEQSFLMDTESGAHRVVSADLEQVLAWKNGLFNFKDEPLTDIVRELERWYDLHIEVDPSLYSNRYSGNLSRHQNIMEIVHILQQTGELAFVQDARGNIRIIPSEE